MRNTVGENGKIIDIVDCLMMTMHQGISSGEYGAGWHGASLTLAEIKVADFVTLVLVKHDPFTCRQTFIFRLSDNFDQALKTGKTWRNFLAQIHQSLILSDGFKRIGNQDRCFPGEWGIRPAVGNETECLMCPQHTVYVVGNFFFGRKDQHGLLLCVSATEQGAGGGNPVCRPMIEKYLGQLSLPARCRM